MAFALRTIGLTRRACHVALCLALATPSAGAAPRPVRPVEITVGGHTYRVPSDVFEGGVVEGGKQSGFLIELAWPEMRGLLPQEMTWPPRATIRVLATTGVADGKAPAASDLDRSLRTTLDIAVGLPFGQHRPLEPSREPPRGPAPEGAVMVASQPFFTDGEANDVFVPEPISGPALFISCNSVGKEYVHASCEEELIAQNLRLKVSYDRDLVNDWNRIASAIVDYLQQHEVQNGIR